MVGGTVYAPPAGRLVGPDEQLEALQEPVRLVFPGYCAEHVGSKPPRLNAAQKRQRQRGDM